MICILKTIHAFLITTSLKQFYHLQTGKKSIRKKYIITILKVLERLPSNFLLERFSFVIVENFTNASDFISICTGIDTFIVCVKKSVMKYVTWRLFAFPYRRRTLRYFFPPDGIPTFAVIGFFMPFLRLNDSMSTNQFWNIKTFIQYRVICSDFSFKTFPSAYFLAYCENLMLLAVYRK